jgi:hypothetical protein
VLKRSGLILLDAATLLITIAEEAFRIGMTQVGGATKPIDCCGSALFHTITNHIRHS